MRVAVLGLGSAGGRHARNLLDLGHEVVGWDPASDPPGGVTTAASMLDAISGCDAVIVASPNSLHAEQARAAIDAGRHVLVEKPIATTAEDARSVAAAAAEAAVVCGVAMNLRFHPAIRRLRALVGGGDLGRIMTASVWFGHDLRRWRPDSDYRTSYSARAELGGGILLDAIHELDYLLWLLGPAMSVSAVTARVSDLEIDVEDLVVAAIEFASGAIASVSLDFVQPSYRRGCTLGGTEAAARWEWSEGAIELQRADRSERIACQTDVGDTYVDELRDFIAAIENGASPATTAIEGVAAVELADAIRRSSAAGRRVDVP